MSVSTETIWPFVSSCPLHRFAERNLEGCVPYYSDHFSFPKESNLKDKTTLRTSLVVQWLRICLPVQGTRVQALVREDTTCHRATKPVRHNY